MTRRGIIALGGGGDVLSATAVARRDVDVVLSLAWEKLSVDPHPGPRAPAELLHTKTVSGGWGEVSVQSQYPNGVVTAQAELLQQFPGIDQLILDPWRGVPGLVTQLERICHQRRLDELIGIDVGGDSLSDQPSPTLTSPLVDALFLGALSAVSIPSHVVVFGVGLDGEVDERILEQSIVTLTQTGALVGHEVLSMESVNRVAGLLRRGQLQSEVNSLLIWSYLGMRGRVVLRDGGMKVTVRRETMLGHKIRTQGICDTVNRLGTAIVDIPSLEQASVKLLSLGHRTELQDQTEILAGREYQPSLLAGSVTLRELLLQLTDAEYVAARYVSRRLGVSARDLPGLIAQSDHIRICEYAPYLALAR